MAGNQYKEMEKKIDATYKRGILKLVLNKLHKDEITHKRVIEVH